MRSKIVAVGTAGMAAMLGLGWVAVQAAEGATHGLVLGPIKPSATLQKKLNDDYGVGELAILQSALERAMHYAWNKGAPATCANGAVVVETTLVDAAPNHPTREQTLRQPSLDYLRSVSVGGADISGVMKAADGTVVATVPARHYAMDIREAALTGETWGDARQALDVYARELVKRCTGA